MYQLLNIINKRCIHGPADYQIVTSIVDVTFNQTDICILLASGAEQLMTLEEFAIFLETGHHTVLEII